MPVYLYQSSVPLQLNAFVHFRTETNFACVCVCVHPWWKCAPRWPVLHFWPVSLGKAAWSLRRLSAMRGLGKILKEIHTHTQTHDSNHGAAVAERSSCTQMLLSSSSQDEAVLGVLCLWSPLAVLPRPLQPFFIWTAVLGRVPLRLMLKWQFMCR